jgi:hypothetical protein
MPVLYGEGTKAFQRLQQEIMKASDDQTIFCWIGKDISPNKRHDLLADSPSAFRIASQFESNDDAGGDAAIRYEQSRVEYQLTLDTY